MDDFRARIQSMLMWHREGSQLCPACTSDPAGYRRHIADLTARIRYDTDQAENRPVSDFPRILAEHVPYVSPNIRGVQCLTCLDGHGGGEYPDTDAWAQHVADKVADARMKVVRRG